MYPFKEVLPMSIFFFFIAVLQHTYNKPREKNRVSLRPSPYSEGKQMSVWQHTAQLGLQWLHRNSVNISKHESQTHWPKGFWLSARKNLLQREPNLHAQQPLDFPGNLLRASFQPHYNWGPSATARVDASRCRPSVSESVHYLTLCHFMSFLSIYAIPLSCPFSL